MQINLDTSKNQSFTAFKLAGGAEDTLRKVLKPKDWKEFSDIIDAQASNTVDIHLFGRGNGKFYAKINPYSHYMKEKTVYQWPFFESAVKFFKKVAKKADVMYEQIKEMPAVNENEILDKMRKS